jgi:hypothetical protein
LLLSSAIVKSARDDFSVSMAGHPLPMTLNRLEI